MNKKRKMKKVTKFKFILSSGNVIETRTEMSLRSAKLEHMLCRFLRHEYIIDSPGKRQSINLKHVVYMHIAEEEIPVDSNILPYHVEGGGNGEGIVTP